MLKLMGCSAMRHVIAFMLLVLMAGGSGGMAQESLFGVASVIDGDTIDIHGQRIRLFGIDTPEKQQACYDAGGVPYRCGQKAAFVLSDFLGQSPVTCEEKAVDRYGRIVGKCFARNQDINLYMVRSGWAMAYRRYASDYIAAEQEAKNNRRGLWVGEFQAPWDWRKAKREGL
jgi:endonuclease YncB( thermonuclease family)